MSSLLGAQLNAHCTNSFLQEHLSMLYYKTNRVLNAQLDIRHEFKQVKIHYTKSGNKMIEEYCVKNRFLKSLRYIRYLKNCKPSDLSPCSKEKGWAPRIYITSTMKLT